MKTFEYNYENKCKDLFMECEGDCSGCPNIDYWKVYLLVKPEYYPRFPKFVIETIEDKDEI